ncbi:MAG: P-loop NTPase [Sporichthyaceae bacterium]|nr:P-loop NTPase [Sporichthyaceae bacterium]
MTVLLDLDPRQADALIGAIGPNVRMVTSFDALEAYLAANPSEYVVVLAPSVGIAPAFDLAERMRVERPALGVVLLQDRVDTSLLGDALRAGVREVVDQRDLATVTMAVRRVAELATRMRERGHEYEPAPPARDADQPPGKILTVFSAKGGCGKTTLATNLAVALAESGDREVCLVDLDLHFGDVAIAMQLYPVHTIADAAGVSGTLDDFSIRGLLTVHSPGVSVLAAPLEPGSAESIPAALVGHLLSQLSAMFDVVVVDTPAAFSDFVLAAFDLTDVFLLIATLDIPALKNLKLTLETMDLLNYPRERWRVVLNRADSKVGLTITEVEKTLRLPISAQIPSSRAVPVSVNRGVPIVQDDPGHPVSLEIRRLGERVATLPSQAGGRGDRRRLLRRKAR